MKPEDFIDHSLINNRSTCTGHKKMAGCVYRGIDIHCLDHHQRLQFNFAAVVCGRYVEFSTLRAAQKFIRGAF